VAKEQDTLRLIAQHYNVSLQAIISKNPHITNVESNLNGGTIVNIPGQTGQDSDPAISYCPPVFPVGRLNHWVPLTPLPQMEQTDYDVLIIGTGAGGSAALWRLCEQLGKSGKRIGVVERGGLLLPTHALNVPTLWSWSRMLEYYLAPRISTPLGASLPEYPGARLVYALGGRTLFWGLTSPRLPPFEFAYWPITYKELEPYYNLAEQLMNVSGNNTPLNKMLLRRLWEQGYPESALLPDAIGRGAFGNYFSSIQFIGEALSLSSFDLAVNARAVRVETDQGKVAGVQVISPDKQAYFLKAKTVIVAGSTFETPRLLLNSDIPGKTIGHYLINHSYMKTEGSLKSDNTSGNSISLLIPQTESRPYQYKITGKGTDISYDISGKVQARFDNFVYLNHHKKDEFGVPEIKVKFSYSEADLAVVHLMEESMRKVAAAMDVSIPADTCIWPPGYDNHDAGTCRMGYDPETSTTNRYGQVHGISGLYVADNSVLPSTGAANPVLTTVAVAIRTADHIIDLLL
jgi:choline dehydrogenase-like flavoprotein